MGVIYYVELTLNLPSPLREHFRLYSAVVVVFSCSMTVLMAIWETRELNGVLKKIRASEPIDAAESNRAGYEAATFSRRHHLFEAWFVPCSTLVPDMLCLRILDGASNTVLTNLTVTVFMGIVMALMSTYFLLEHSMKPVISYLLDHGVSIDFARIPRGRLRLRFGVSFALIILTTALMIGTLARQRAADIIDDPQNQAMAVENLRNHSLIITVVAVVIGIVYSTVLTDSVARRVGRLIDAMNRVARGQLSERLQTTGNDELDALTRHFNAMVRELEHNDHTIRDLNLNLQGRVRERTAQLESTIRELQQTQSQLTDVAHRAGMAEVATGVLHNVGNVLNSVNISVSLVTDQVRHSKLVDLEGFVSRLTTQGDRLSDFLAAEGRAQKLVDFLQTALQRLKAEHGDLLRESESLGQKVEHIKGIIHAQQAYAKQVSFRERVDLGQLIDDVLKLHSESLRKHSVEVRVESGEVPAITVEKAKLLQVVENLVKNAIESIVQCQATTRQITIRIQLLDSSTVTLLIADTGSGIRSEDLERVFSYGFTTKPTGNGFGLHASALAVASAGGKIYARSPGVGQGAVFTVELPVESRSTAETPADRPAARSRKAAGRDEHVAIRDESKQRCASGQT
jgi:signal transduction histidine kinase